MKQSKKRRGKVLPSNHSACTKHGGRRAGAGRPRTAETTRVMRIPLRMFTKIKTFLQAQGFCLPLYASRVPAGAPNSAEDVIEETVDIPTLLIGDGANTFLLRVKGDSMIDAGIMDGDLLFVDRATEARNGQIVVAALDGNITVKKLKKTRQQIQLLPANTKYTPINVTEPDNFSIVGVVRASARRYY